MSSLHQSPPLSAPAAARRAGVSRWTIVRAINDFSLKARRDNRNRFRIAPEDLEAWKMHRERTVADAPPVAPPAMPDNTVDLRAALAGERARADAAERATRQAEADRDRWQAMAETLATRPRFSWPWNR